MQPQAKARLGLQQLSNSHRTLQEGVEASKTMAFKAQVEATEEVVAEAGVVAEEASEEAEDVAVTRVVQASNAILLLHLVAALDKTARFSILQALTTLGLPRAKQLEQVSSSNNSLALGSRANRHLTYLDSLIKCPNSQDTNPSLTMEEASGHASLVLSATNWQVELALLTTQQTKTQATRARIQPNNQQWVGQLSSARMFNPQDKQEHATISVADFAIL